MEKPKRARKRKPETSQGGPEAITRGSPEGRFSGKLIWTRVVRNQGCGARELQTRKGLAKRSPGLVMP